jgi:hypothetical protein
MKRAAIVARGRPSTNKHQSSMLIAFQQTPAMYNISNYRETFNLHGILAKTDKVVVSSSTITDSESF